MVFMFVLKKSLEKTSKEYHFNAKRQFQRVIMAKQFIDSTVRFGQFLEECPMRNKATMMSTQAKSSTDMLTRAQSKFWQWNYCETNFSAIDRINMSESYFYSVSLGKDPDGNDFWLYYSPMILVEGPLCGAWCDYKTDFLLFSIWCLINKSIIDTETFSYFALKKNE